MGVIETRLKGYWNASQAAQIGDEAKMELQLEAVVIMMPFRMQVGYKDRIKKIKHQGYSRAAQIAGKAASDCISNFDISGAVEQYERLQHCNEHLGNEHLEKILSQLEYGIEIAKGYE